MSPEFYSSIFILFLGVYAVASALWRRNETDSRDSYTWVFLACLSMSLAMASNIALQSGTAVQWLQPVLDTTRFWGGAGFVYFLYSWTLTVDPWRKTTRRRATLAAAVAAVAVAVIPSHGNQSVAVPADWQLANWIGIALYYGSLLYITSFFVNIRAQKAVTPGLPWVILFQKVLLWIAMYMGAAFFTARILLAVAGYMGFQPLSSQTVSVVQEIYKSVMGVFFLLGLLPPRWLVRLVRKLEHADNVSWQSQYVVQATADLNDGGNPVYRHALVTYVSLLADQCHVPQLSKIDLLQAASLLGTDHPLATPTGEVIRQAMSLAAPDFVTNESPKRPPIVVSSDVARLLQTASRDGGAPVTKDLKSSVLQASDCFVREAYRDGLSSISPDDAQRGWTAVQAAVADKAVLRGLGQVLLDAGLLSSHNVAEPDNSR